MTQWTLKIAQNTRKKPTSFAEKVTAGLNDKGFTFKYDDENTLQSVSLGVLELSLIDFFTCMSSLSKDLEKVIEKAENPTMLNPISAFLEQLNAILSKQKEDPLLSLLAISHSPSALLAHLMKQNIPDPLGILGMSSDVTLYQDRTSKYHLSRMMNIAKAQPQTQVQLLPVATGEHGGQTTTASRNSMFSVLLDQLTKNTSDVVVPNIRSENYILKIREAFEKTQFPLEIQQAYIDAASSIFEMYIAEKVISPEAIERQMQNEFIQNLRLLILERAASEMDNAVKSMAKALSDLPNASFLNAQIIENWGVSTALNEACDHSLQSVRESREIHQNVLIKTIASNILNTAKYFRTIAASFGSIYNNSQEPAIQQIAILFGINPNERLPEGLKRNNERRTLLHDAAARGNPDLIEALVFAGSDIDPLVVPIQSWGEWLYSWTLPLRMMVNYIACTRSPELQGDTPLLYAARALSSELDEHRQKEYASVALKLITYGANPYIYDRTGNAPANLLQIFLNSKGASLPSDPPVSNLSNALQTFAEGKLQGAHTGEVLSGKEGEPKKEMHVKS